MDLSGAHHTRPVGDMQPHRETADSTAFGRTPSVGVGWLFPRAGGCGVRPPRRLFEGAGPVAFTVDAVVDDTIFADGFD